MLYIFTKMHKKNIPQKSEHESKKEATRFFIPSILSLLINFTCYINPHKMNKKCKREKKMECQRMRSVRERRRKNFIIYYNSHSYSINNKDVDWAISLLIGMRFIIFRNSIPKWFYYLRFVEFSEYLSLWNSLLNGILFYAHCA